MFEGVLSQLLAGYLGHYVKGIQREQFRIGLWSGEAQLENVELRLEAFDYLQLPFSIKQGTVGKLKFQVPWQKLGWEPILISLEDVNLLAGPHEDSEWDGEASERRAVAAKKAALAAAEIAKLSQRVSEDKSGETFLSYLSAKIIDNVQVTVSKVHLRYVDGETDPEAVFSFGVTLSSLAITTTDGRDHPALPSMSVNAGKGAGSKVHKLVDLQRLAVYWNTESSSMLSPGNSDTSNEPGSTGPTVSDPENAKIYLLQPTNAKLRLTVDKNASVKGGGPHYSVAIDVDNLFVSLAEGQLQQMLMLAEALSVSQLRERYARFRPSMSRPFSENTGWQRRLWQFAIQAVVSDVRRYRRKLKGNFGLFNSRRQHYVLLYKEKLEALQRVQPAKDTRFAELEEMELELEMDEILFFRSVAENELLGSASGQDVFENAAGEPETTNGRAESREDDGALQAVPQSQRPFSQQRGWLNWLSLGLLGAAESIDAAVFPDQIIKDLCEAADFNPTSVIESGYHTKGWCRLILSVRVGEAVGILRNYETEIVSITLQRASVTSISWLDSTSVSILVPSLELVDLCTSGSEFPRILAPKARQPIRRSYSLAVQQNLGEVGVSNALVQSSSDSKLEAMKDEPGTSSAGYVEQNEHVVEVKITTGSQEFGIFISVSVQPVEFVYSSTFIQQAVDFLSQPAPYEKREELVTSCLDKIVISAGESSSRTGSTHPSKKRIRWTISVQKPTFLFPENNTVKDGVLMVFAWDSLEITSTELQSAMSTVSDIERNQRFGRGSDSSEQFEVQLTGIQVIIVSKYSNWQNKLSHDADQQSHLLERCNLHMGIRCVPSPSTRTIRLKISGEVTTLHTHLSLWKCVALKAVVAQIMSFRNRTEIEQATSSPTISRFVESSEGEQGNQLITSNDLGPAFELNLCFKAVTANLRVDGESGSSEVQETVLVAKMHDANVRFSRWNSQKEVIAFMVNKFHVEDANEVAGSSSRDLLCPSKDFAPSPTSARKDLITAEEAKFGSPRTSSSIKNAFAARISRSVVAGRSISAVNFHLQGMECHCHPKVMRALYWFVTAVTEAKPVDTNAGEEDDGSYSVNEGEQVSSEEVRRPFLEAGSATEDELADGSDTPMVLEFRDLVVHLYDPGGIIASLEFGDASVSIFSPKADHGSLKVVVSARGLKIKGPVWASGNCRGEVFGSCSNGPLATLNVSVIKNRRTRSPSGLTYKLTEVNTSLHNVQCILNSDYLALLIGYCVSSEWAFSINHDNLRNIGATGYSCTVGTHRSVVIWTVEISNSMVLLPRESDSIEFIELLIPRVFVSFTPSELTVPQSGSSGREPSAEDSPSTMDVVYVSCQELAITVRGLFQSAETIDTSGLTLIERADGEIIVELPVLDKASRDLETSPPIPINSQLDITVLVSNLAGSATGRSIDLLKEGEKELSSVSWKYKLYAKGGTSHWIRDHSPFRNLTPPVAPESPFSMRLSISQLTLFIKETYEASMDVAKLVADNLHLSCLISRGDLETLILEVLSIDMFEGLSLRPMLHVSTADDGGEDRKLFPLITYSSPELHLTLPNIRLWMHISAWVSVISATASCLTSSSEQPQDVEPPEEQRFQSGVPPLSASEASSSRVGLLQRRSDESIKDGADVAAFLKPGCNGSLTESSLRLSVGATRITCIVPDFLENVSMGPVPRTTLARRKLVRIVSWTGVTTDTDEPLGEDEMQETKNMDGVNESGKQILLSSTICINELELRRDKMWKLSASITQTEAVVEEVFLEKHKFRMALMQVKDVEIEGRINVPGTPWTSMAFSVVVKSVDVWCSYANLHFLSNFCFEPLKSQSSSATDTHCSLDLRLHNCSILLSDSRWSCNAPIMEVLLRNIISEIAWRRLNFNCSLVSDVEINYHNIQKVAWEPLLEPWSLCCRMSRTGDGNSILTRPYRKKLEITSSAPLNLNITEALVQAVSRAVEMLSESWSASIGGKLSTDFSCTDSQSAVDLSMRRFAPYWLQNDTGIPFRFWFVGTARSEEHDDENSSSSLKLTGELGGSEIVQPGSAVPLFIEETLDEMFSRRRAGLVADQYNSKKLFSHHLHRKICVKLEGTTRASLPISIDHVGSKFFEAVFSGGESVDGSSRTSHGSSFQEIDSEKSFHAPVFFEVTAQRYSKLIRLSSMVSVVNRTSVALELRFDHPFLLSPKVMDPVLPGQVMALPVHLAETGRMRWRPLGSKHLWSETQSLPNLRQLPVSHSGFHRVVCSPCHPSDATFRCCIMVTNQSVSAAESDSVTPSKGKHKLATRRSNTRDNSELGSSSGSQATDPSLFWTITLNAPLVLKNCLPFSLTAKVESGAGVANTVCALEGDSLFLYDIDTTHDVSLSISCPPYSPATVNLKNAVLWTTDTTTSAQTQNTRVTSVEELVLKSEINTDSPVSVKAEITKDLVSGARELRLSCPFWLYNCSDLNLAVMDGDVDIASGIEQHIAGPTRNEKTLNEDISLISAGTRFFGTVSGLQTILEASEPEAIGTVVRRKVQMGSRSRSFTTRPPVSSRGRASAKLKGKSVESSPGGSPAQKPSAGESLSNRMVMYSPVQGTEVSEPHLRARIVPCGLNEQGKKDSSELNWSRPFLLEPPGGINIVTVPKPDNTGAYVLAVISAPTLGSSAGRTKTITFRPRFVIANVSKQALCYKQKGTDAFHRLDRGNHAQLHWHDTSREFLISVRIDDHGWDWSGGFAPDQLGDTQVKVRNHTTGTTEMLRVEVSIVGGTAGGAEGAGPAGGSLGTCLILLSNDDTGFMPYRIENFTLERLRFYQQKCEKMENMLQSYSSCTYAWDEPRRPHRLVIEIPGAGRPLGAYGLDEVREYPSITLGATSERTERKWLVHVRAEGPIRVLSIVDASVHVVKGTSPLSENFVGGQNLEPPFELFDEFSVQLAHVGFSIIDNYPQEVVYACARDLGVRFLQGQYQQILNFDVAWFQIDNQLRYAVYPVMLSVANSPPDASITNEDAGREIIDVNTPQTSGLPFRAAEESAFALSIARWRNPTGSVVCYRYISMRVEPLRLELEERVVSSLLQLTESISWSAFSRDANALPTVSSQPWSVINGSQQVGASMRPFSSAPWKYDMEQAPATGVVRFLKQVQRLEEYRCWAAAVAVEPLGWNADKLFSLARERSKAYIEILHIAPVTMSVSFSSSPWLAEEGRGAAARSLLWMTGTLLQRQVRALVDVEGAPVHLRQLKLAHPLASWDVIWGMITRHYTRQLLHEVYKVLGSADVFGNPVGFIRSVASGVWEFVSAPATSIVQSPTELVRGLAYGTRSLVTNTVFAFSNAATRFSRAARKGMTVFALDSEYDLAMQRRLHMEGSQDISVVNEFLEGLTGLLQAPIRGAEKHGLPGVLSGAALGVVGVVARPVASILEVAGMTAQSIRNSSRPAQWRASRIRLPRYVSDYSPLLVYSWERAVGQAVLLEAGGSRYKTDVDFVCMPLRDSKFVLLTETTIIRVSKRTFEDASTSNPTYGRQWNLELEAAIDDILHMDRTGTEVSVLLGPPNRPLIRPHYQGVMSSRYVTRFTPFAHETFTLESERAATDLFSMLMRLEDESRKARSKLLLASSTSLSSSDFLDLDKFF